MRYLKLLLLVLLFPLITASTTHKYYVSITKIEYVQESGALQIITQIFIDDIEEVLQKRYNDQISLGTSEETEADANYLKTYILQKLNIKVNGEDAELDYLGKEYDVDMVKSYIEIMGVKKLEALEVENKVLFDLFEEQQNIIHLKTPDKRRSLILDKDNPKGMLNFN